MPLMPIILHIAVMMVLPGKYRLGTLPAGKGQQQEIGRAQTMIDATIGRLGGRGSPMPEMY